MCLIIYGSNQSIVNYSKKTWTLNKVPSRITPEFVSLHPTLKNRDAKKWPDQLVTVMLQMEKL